MTGEEVVGIVPLCENVHVAVAVAFVLNCTVEDPVVKTLLICLFTTISAITTVTAITAVTVVVTVQIS